MWSGLSLSGNKLKRVTEYIQQFFGYYTINGLFFVVEQHSNKVDKECIVGIRKLLVIHLFIRYFKFYTPRCESVTKVAK